MSIFTYHYIFLALHQSIAHNKIYGLCRQKNILVNTWDK
jgi:siroheme synthase (precorrin-2 oxidase/ferrochelatase)